MGKSTSEYFHNYDFNADPPDYDYGNGYCDGYDTLVAVENFLIHHSGLTFTPKEMAKKLRIKTETCTKYLSKHPYAEPAPSAVKQVKRYRSVAPKLEPTPEGIIEAEEQHRRQAILADYWSTVERGARREKKVPKDWKLVRHMQGTDQSRT